MKGARFRKLLRARQGVLSACVGHAKARLPLLAFSFPDGLIAPGSKVCPESLGQPVASALDARRRTCTLKVLDVFAFVSVNATSLTTVSITSSSSRKLICSPRMMREESFRGGSIHGLTSCFVGCTLTSTLAGSISRLGQMERVNGRFHPDRRRRPILT